MRPTVDGLTAASTCVERALESRTFVALVERFATQPYRADPRESPTADPAYRTTHVRFGVGTSEAAGA